MNVPYTTAERPLRPAPDRSRHPGRLATTSVAWVSGGLKIDHLRFTLEDRALPLLGLPITIHRTYDSRDPSPGDFGAGWRLDIQTTRLRTGRPLGTDWTQGPPGPPSRPATASRSIQRAP